jgi:hypothetical protein
MATRYPHSWPSASRSSSERRGRASRLASLLAACALASGCGDDEGGEECGAGGQPADGVTIDVGGDAEASVEFGQFDSSPNNDCTPPGGGPTSLTIQGEQSDPADPSRFLVFCLPRPDRIADQAIPLDDEERVQLVDLVAAPADGCRLELDRDRPLAGEITFSGFCDDGVHPDGYAMAFSATVPLLRTCSEKEPEAIDAEMGGAAAVSAASP